MTILDSKGYLLILKRDHKFVNSHGYVFEHRFIYEQYYKCCLLPWTIIHHKNEIRTDNRIENLEPMFKNKHNSLHKIGQKYAKKDMSKRQCINCNFNGQTHWRKQNNGYTCNICYMKAYQMKRRSS